MQCGAYRFGSFVLDLGRGALLGVNCGELPLRPKSFELLELLVENEGRLLSREAIMERLWPNIFVTENNVTQCIHDIRNALGPEAHQLLRTVPRRGYIFVSDVIKVPGPDSHRCNNRIIEGSRNGSFAPGAAAHREDGQPAANDNNTRPRPAPLGPTHPANSPSDPLQCSASLAASPAMGTATRAASAGLLASTVSGQPADAWS
jgi:DNA-binding winged helix-turn-helix (wHTH) protein